MNSSGADQDNLHFAGLERDSESGTEHAQFRNYASAQGRWLAPDSYMGSYDLTNPQSMNRYAYALNNPASFIDPSGLDYGYDCGDNCVGVVGTDTVGGGEISCWSCSFYGVTYSAGVITGAPQIARPLPPPSTLLSQHTGFDNPLANALFSPRVGGAYFGAAYNAVNYATVATAALYGAALAAPGIASTGSLAQSAASVGPFGPALGRVFWSGGIAAGIQAAQFADQSGGMTLEMTPIGEFLSSVAPNSETLWGAASNAFASGAIGDVSVVQGDFVRLQSAWASIEYDILDGKNAITFISASGAW